MEREEGEREIEGEGRGERGERREERKEREISLESEETLWNGHICSRMKKKEQSNEEMEKTVMD
jgi:hypothetical protein